MVLSISTSVLLCKGAGLLWRLLPIDLSLSACCLCSVLLVLIWSSLLLLLVTLLPSPCLLRFRVLRLLGTVITLV